MFPVLRIGSFAVPTFSLCVAVGVVIFFLAMVLKLRACGRMAEECFYVLPKLCIAFGAAFVGAVLLDALCKIPQNGRFRISGMTFYGGLIGGTGAFAALVAACRKNTAFSVTEWLNTTTLPFVLFHIFGRIGCFFGGCCYGKVTQSFLGVHFPDQPDVGIYHYGQKVFPTQLWEAAGLAVIAAVIAAVKNKKAFMIYAFAYPVLRFVLEWWRGDVRGAYMGAFSPAQVISLLVLATATAVCAVCCVRKRREKKQI